MLLEDVMHGLILTSLRNFIVSMSDEKVWKEICRAANVENPYYLPIKTYPDSEVMQICMIAAQKYRIPQSQFLEEFGKFLSGELMKHYKNWVHPDWDSLDFLLNTQCVMHAVAKRVSMLPTENPDPPTLSVRRLDEKHLELVYQSPRKLCHLAKGLIIGVGHYYKEPLHVEHPTCMLRGDRTCTFIIAKNAPIAMEKERESFWKK